MNSSRRASAPGRWEWGGAFVALADDGAAGYWNPAGLGRLDRPEILLMHASRFAGEVNFDYFSIEVFINIQSSFNSLGNI